VAERLVHRTYALLLLRTATATAAERISATLGSEVFHGDAHALLMTVYKDLKLPIGLRMEAAKAALPYEGGGLLQSKTRLSTSSRI
jgi:hypothetical protein